MYTKTNAEKIEEHLALLRTLRASSGLFMASAQNVSTGYDKAWLRDNFYESLAFEAVEDWDTVRTLWRAMLDIFLKHKEKIDWAVKHRPFESWQYIHARYHPETFDEFWEEWGNKQNDAVGCVVWKLCDLSLRGIPVLSNEEDFAMVQTLINYLGAIEYWQDPDNGVWEENEEVHASSVGAVLAGLKKASLVHGLHVPEEFITKGEEALRNLLPRESVTKFSDLALLSLIFPYRLVEKSLADAILQNLEYHLVRDRGVIRYKNDQYYNKNADMVSEEAEWTMGFPWLAIIYRERGDTEKALYYLKKTESVLTSDGKLPELYYSNVEKPNENTPLGWSESLYIVALKWLEGEGS